MPEARFRSPRGTADILPEDQPFWRWVRDSATRVAESYGYGEIQTPVFEHAGVFLRPGSEGTDVADKEVYRFQDRGGDDLVLRPEGTAAVCRAYLEHGLANRPQPVRLFYFIDSFRYDRPQAGRYRVFHQFGVEVIGDGDPAIDVEVIDLLRTFFDALGLGSYILILNSIGDQVCRPAYIEKLRAYYAGKIDRMCADCRRRYDVNPLRLLDCKNEPCQPFKADAPKIADNLCEPCAEHFTSVRSLLEGLGIDYTLDFTLVRGLDYYTRTAFEFLPTDETGQQSALGGGGRYDGLMEQLGGRPTPAIGFGTGMERIILNLKRQELEPPNETGPDVFIAIASADLQARALKLARDLRADGSKVITGNANRSLKSQFGSADASGARQVMIIGARDLAEGMVTVRNLQTREEHRLPLDKVSRRQS